MLRTLCALPIVAVAFAAAPPSAGAFPDFFKAFVAEYIDENENEEYVTLVKKEAKCYVCHQGRKKSNNNPYGLALDEFLDKKDRKDTEKIVDALKKVAEMHSVEGDEESPTFGELIAAGKLPGGDLETVKQEPSGGDSEE